MEHELMDPKLPNEGEKITVFGLTAFVSYVEPQSDYMWKVTAVVLNSGEEMIFYIPTDFLTVP